MRTLIKRVLPNCVKVRISNIKKDRYYNPLLEGLRISPNNKRIVLIGTPEHGNLGDHLIAEAEIKFLQDCFSAYEIIEVTGEHYRYQRNAIFRLIKNTDIIVITGGGFLGSLWIIEENMVRDIIASFHENKIIIFPSTIYFENNEDGREELEKSKRIYCNHKDLSICVRDENSIDVAKGLLGFMNEHKIIYTPDMALYLNKYRRCLKRDGILFCLREDKEKVLDDSEIDVLENSVKKKGMPIKKTTTVIPRRVKKEDRNNELQSLTNEFRRTQLVITDRLHGMIFAAITGTPCIAMDNLSGKIKGVHSWIKYLGYIKFANNIEEIYVYVDELLKLGDQSYNNDALMPAFEMIVRVMKYEENISDKTCKLK